MHPIPFTGIVRRLSCGSRPNKVSESTVSTTKLSDFWGSSWENSVSAVFQPSTRTIFGSELLVRGISVSCSCFGVVLPMDLRCYLNFISRANFWFKALLSVHGVSVLICLHFCTTIGFYLPEVAREIFLLPRGAFYGKFSGANFWFEARLSVNCVFAEQGCASSKLLLRRQA